MLGVGGWAFATGRLGFGPLSAADQEAADVIAAEVPGPAWASESQLQCAADELIGERRSGDLAETGLIEEDGDSWTYTGEWEAADASAFTESILDCSEDWEEQLGEQWALSDTECLGEVGAPTVADYLAVDALEVSGDAATQAADAAVADLDECYVTDPTLGKVTTTPVYRGVRFTFAESTADNAQAKVTIEQDGSERTLRGSTYRAAAEEGGAEVCVTARVTAKYAWGTTAEASGEECGKAEPKRIYWRELPRCDADGIDDCRSWELRYEGFASFTDVSATLRQNGGDCDSQSGQCTFTTSSSHTGRGGIVTWSALPDWSEEFVAVVDGMTAKLPN
ncbi:hypothetical protein [Nocardioides sambongensis]|uniref:hypothetical protein n=1 Tax=Nocardioides sambongensis TaxID=2589074 RepID=UPI0011290260|nr:hypothetical protein [Nocardioides sambongensis]